MNQFCKRIAALTLPLALPLPLPAGPGGGFTEEDATAYVQGILDENYKGTATPEFIASIDSSEEEIQEVYQTSIETEADFLIGSLLDNPPPDEQREELIQLYKDIYANASYTVESATEIDDTTFGVKVTVEPIDIFHLMAEEATSGEEFAALNASYPDQMTEEEYAAYEEEWFQLILDTLEAKLPELGYLEPQSQVVQVTLDDDGLWGFNEQDFYNLDVLIIDYNF